MSDDASLLRDQSSDLDVVEIGEAQREALRQTDRVLRQVRAERARQFMKWGWGRNGAEPNADPVGHDHDDRHVEGDWSRFIVRFVGRAEEAIEHRDPTDWREAMVCVAALAVAAIESHDRRNTPEARRCP